MTRILDLHAEWMQDENYRREFEELEEQFELLKANEAQDDAPRKDVSLPEN